MAPGCVVLEWHVGTLHRAERLGAHRYEITPYPCTIRGRPLLGKGKLQDFSGAWSDAAIRPASGATANHRGPVWEFADRVHINAA